MTLASSKSRRAFMRDGALLIAASQFTAQDLFAADETDKAVSTLRVGLITDLHFADKETAGSRHYRETPAKLKEAIAKFKSLKTDFVVELGDLVDKAPSVETELSYLNAIDKQLKQVPGDKHYVLGNHCVDTLTKHEFLLTVGQPKSYYSFDKQGWHFVILDACFNSDDTPYERRNSKWNNANVSKDELVWLEHDLATNKLPTIVFAHQRLDESGPYSVKNREAVRKCFAERNVVAVFQGHSHDNDHQEIEGVHYVTLVAMVEGSGDENNAYSVLELTEDTLKVTGFRKQQNQSWPVEN